MGELQVLPEDTNGSGDARGPSHREFGAKVVDLGEKGREGFADGSVAGHGRHRAQRLHGARSRTDTLARTSVVDSVGSARPLASVAPNIAKA